MTLNTAEKINKLENIQFRVSFARELIEEARTKLGCKDKSEVEKILLAAEELIDILYKDATE